MRSGAICQVRQAHEAMQRLRRGQADAPPAPPARPQARLPRASPWSPSPPSRVAKAPARPRLHRVAALSHGASPADGQITVTRTGDGPEVLLVHGGASAATTWRGIEGLSDSW